MRFFVLFMPDSTGLRALDGCEITPRKTGLDDVLCFLRYMESSMENWSPWTSPATVHMYLRAVSNVPR